MITRQDLYDHPDFGLKLTFVDAIAATAHGACGQTRADGTTPYIAHPRMAVDILLEQGQFTEVTQEVFELVAATLLHDVVEDTKIDKDFLVRVLVPVLYTGSAYRIVHLVMLVTKPQDKMTEEQKDLYYLGIERNFDAKRIKAADRSANLRDSIEQVKAGQNVERWEKYLYKTVNDILPMYEKDSRLIVQYEALSGLVIQLLSAIGQHQVKEKTPRSVTGSKRCNAKNPPSNWFACSLNADHVGHSPHAAHEYHDLNKRKVLEWS